LPVPADAPFIGFIPVRDLAAARAFYEGTLGLRVVADTEFALVLDAGGTMLRVTPVPGLAARSFTIAGWNVPDIDAVVRDLMERGVQFTRYAGMTQDELGVWTTPGGDRVACSPTQTATPCRSRGSPPPSSSVPGAQSPARAARCPVMRAWKLLRSRAALMSSATWVSG
jgi:predicted enzyme related to lactoylglutathione lyase